MLFHIIDQLVDRLRKPGTGIIRRGHPRDQNMAVATGNLASFGPISCLTRCRIDIELARGAMSAGDVITVAAEILRRCFPVGLHHPTVRPAHLGAPSPRSKRISRYQAMSPK